MVVDKEHIDEALGITVESFAEYVAKARAWEKANTEIHPLENAVFTYLPHYDGDDFAQDYTCTWSFEDDGIKYAYVEDRQKCGQKGLNTFEITYPAHKYDDRPEFNRPGRTEVYELIHSYDTDRDNKTNLKEYIDDLTWRLTDGIRSYLEELYPDIPGDRGYFGGFNFGDNKTEDTAPKKVYKSPERTGLNKEIWDKVLKHMNEYRSEYDREKYDVYDYGCMEKLLIAYYFLATAKDSITIREK